MEKLGHTEVLAPTHSCAAPIFQHRPSVLKSEVPSFSMFKELG